MKFTYKWKLSDLKKVKKNKLKVFSCFACGGGSTMGYKTSGFDVIGCNEIDSKMMKVYIENHNPKFSFLESIRDFKLRKDLPKELYNLDILDGSPPCSSFSTSGTREKDWGKKKKFKEGQKEQVLDDLFFDFADLVKKLKPKVVVAENVKGIISGNAKGYVKEVINRFKKSGYDVQLFLLDASTMGVPQKRQRVFFICSRKELKFPKLKLNFNEKPILMKEIKTGNSGGKLSEVCLKLWRACEPGKSFSTVHHEGSFFNSCKLSPNKICSIITSARGSQTTLWDKPRKLNDAELIKIGSFPSDYNFLNERAQYLIGMSVPPLMMHKISEQIYKQWFCKKVKQ